MSEDASQRFNGAVKRVAALYIQALGIVTSMINDLAVTAAKLAAAAVTRAKLGIGGIVNKTSAGTIVTHLFSANNFSTLNHVDISSVEGFLLQAMIGSGRIVKAKMRVEINTRDAATVIILRKNGVDQGITITIPATTTGKFDSVGTAVEFADGDELSWSIPSSGTAGSVQLNGSTEVEYDN